MFYEPFLYVSSAIDVQLEVECRRLHVIMAQVILDFRKGMAREKHIDGIGMTETLHRVDAFQTFGRQRHGEVLFADAIDAMTSEFLTPLIDKQTLLILGFWSYAVLADITLNELRGFRFNFDKPVSVALTQDGQGFLLVVEVIEVQGGDLRSPGP